MAVAAKKKAKPEEVTDCGCIDKLNAALKERNAKVSCEMLFDFNAGTIRASGASIRLEKLDSKKRSTLPVFLCRYCPVCGKKCP
jgi:hypothetical protein